MIREQLHGKIVENRDRAEAWFKSKNRGLAFPFYSSFDIRDAGYKLGPVDANIFPAGFNNICPADRDSSVELAKNFLDGHYSASIQKILLLTEEHTQNPYYWNNVITLRGILEDGGREVRIAIPRRLEAPLTVKSASGLDVTVYSGFDMRDFAPDLVISNNDFSLEYEEWAKDLDAPMNPPHELGWYRRRKDRFFKVYNELAGELAELIDVDPWHLQVETEVFPGFEVDDEGSRDRLAVAADGLYQKLKRKYSEHGIEREPFLFIKNNAGTYGLGVTQVKHPDEIRTWTYKSRKKMKAAKGGREITEVIIQEGIPTTLQADGGGTAEPVIYMIGCRLAGGFLRAHSEKGDESNLNAPGAVFQRLCLSDLDVRFEGCPMENCYGWLARLSVLSVAREAQELGVEFKGYSTTSLRSK